MFLSQRLLLLAKRGMHCRKSHLFILLLLISVWAKPALSDTLYAYTGTDFVSVVGFSEPQITTSDFLHMSFTLAGLPVICPTGCFVSAMSLEVGTNVGSGGDVVFQSVFLQTNASGAIVAWNISGCFFMRPPECDENFSSGAQSGQGLDILNVGDILAFSGAAGTWEITTVPEPTTLITFASGLAFLAGRLRHKRRQL